MYVADSSTEATEQFSHSTNALTYTEISHTLRTRCTRARRANISAVAGTGRPLGSHKTRRAPISGHASYIHVPVHAALLDPAAAAVDMRTKRGQA